MGGDIDYIGDISFPDYYKKEAKNINSKAYIFHSRRLLLLKVMNKAGFTQHPNEWWHFSYGDQLWCWKNNEDFAIYGAVSNVSNFIAL